MGIPHSLLWLIGIATFLLSVDAAVSLALVSTMVAFLHDHGHGPFAVTPRGKSPFLLFDEPASLVTDQGHTGNAAGGTALVLVGFGGVISLWRESRTRKKWTRSSHLFYIWSVVVLLSWFLTTAALIYTLVETSMTSGQAIDVGVAWRERTRRLPGTLTAGGRPRTGTPPSWLCRWPAPTSGASLAGTCA